MEYWRTVWRDGFAPGLPPAGLAALLTALETDDRRLEQGLTTSPPPLLAVQDWPVEGADALGFIGWQGEDLTTVGDVEEFFAKACFDADQRLGDPAACRWFLNWFDDTPRGEMRRELAGEVIRELINRGYVRQAMVSSVPIGFMAPLITDPADSAQMGIIADWLDDHDEPDKAAGWRAAHNQALKEKAYSL